MTAPSCGVAGGLHAARRLLSRAWRRPQILRDEYIDWLMLAVAGMQHPGNAYLFDIAIRQAPAAPMLEIGSFCGLSACIIEYVKRKHGRTMPLFCCDSWVFEGSEKALPAAAPVSREDIREHVLESFARAARRFSAGAPPFAIEASSDEFFRAWAARESHIDLFGRHVALGGELGFCFIDGNHSAEIVLRDFTNCDHHLLVGGLILFDDSGDDTDWAVRKVIRRVRASRRYELVARNPNYLFRKTA